MKRPLPMDEILWHAAAAAAAKTGKTVCEIQAARRAQGAEHSKPDGLDDSERYPVTDHVHGLPVSNAAK